MSADMQEEKNASRQQQQELIDWRRGQVIQLISKGKNLTQIAEILNVDVSTICRDYQYIKENANIILQKYFAETVILEVTKYLSRLTSISDEAWKMAEQADKEGDKKAKATALSLAQKAALDLVKILTDNHWLVDEAYKVKEEEKKKKEQQHRSSGREPPIVQEFLLVKPSESKVFVDQQQYFFETLWNKAIPARQQFKEIKQGAKTEFVETVQDTYEIQ